MIMMALSTSTRIKGCIVGGALGDAVGLYTEFLDRQRAIEYYGENPRFSLLDNAIRTPSQIKMDRHRGKFPLSAWTDDTDQSLLILLSFMKNGRIDEMDFARRLQIWVNQGLRCLDRLPLGIGRTIGGVVTSPGYADDPKGVAKAAWEKGGQVAASNGAIMRSAIIGALEYTSIERAMDAAIRVAQTTHADPRCLISSAIVAGFVAKSIRGELTEEEQINQLIDDVENLFQQSLHALPQEHIDELRHFTNLSHIEELELDRPPSIGYTFKALGTAIWALRQAFQRPPDDLFENIITEITMQAGDADTNATVAGSLVGAFLGYKSLPQQWIHGLHEVDWLVDKANKLCVQLGVQDGQYDPAIDPDLLYDGGKGTLSEEELDARLRALFERIVKLTGPRS